MKIYIASHRHLNLPCNDLYQPLFVGAHKVNPRDRLLTWVYDDAYKGNISKENNFYCELTGLHWIWKQSNEGVVGLVHYRRLFESPKSKLSPITHADIEELLSKYDCILPQKIPCMTNNGRLVSVAEQQRTFHPGTDFTQLALVLKKYHPSYYAPFLEFTQNEVTFAPYNMIICRKSLLDEYATWLFDVDHKLGKRISPLDIRTPYQQRVYGFLSERLLNVYLYKHSLSYYQCAIYDPTNTAVDLYEPLANCPMKCPTFTGDSPRPVHDGIDYSPVFDTSFYLSHYADLYNAFSDCPEFALDHYLSCGIEEGRVAHPCFSISSYIHGNPDIWRSVGFNRLEMVHHFIKHRVTARRAIGFEGSFYEPVSERAGSRGIKLSEYKREHYLRIAERRGFID